MPFAFTPRLPPVGFGESLEISDVAGQSKLLGSQCHGVRNTLLKHVSQVSLDCPVPSILHTGVCPSVQGIPFRRVHHDSWLLEDTALN